MAYMSNTVYLVGGPLHGYGVPIEMAKLGRLIFALPPRYETGSAQRYSEENGQSTYRQITYDVIHVSALDVEWIFVFSGETL
jgi:hypothetical protein